MIYKFYNKGKQTFGQVIELITICKTYYLFSTCHTREMFIMWYIMQGSWTLCDTVTRIRVSINTNATNFVFTGTITFLLNLYAKRKLQVEDHCSCGCTLTR